MLARELKGDNLRALLNEWEICLVGMRKVPDDEMLESLFSKQLKFSKQFEQTMLLYQLGITQNGESRSYEKLVSMARSHLEERRRKKVRDAKDEDV